MSIEFKSKYHLFRYVSEWDPQEKGKTKCGYLEGQIQLPTTQGGLRMVLSTYPCSLPGGLEDICRDIHPTLLHVVRKMRRMRIHEMEPVPNIHHWRQEFIINNTSVTIINNMSKADVDRDIMEKQELFMLKNKNVLTFGKEARELNMIILIPKIDAHGKGGDVTLKNLLGSRIQTKDVLNAMDNHFKGKNSVNLKKVKLKVDFYRLSE
jgi:hypothetical protein